MICAVDDEELITNDGGNLIACIIWLIYYFDSKYSKSGHFYLWKKKMFFFNLGWALPKLGLTWAWLKINRVNFIEHETKLEHLEWVFKVLKA